jgi:[ribosomal protein S5]-alanine N-acetyltransferase
MANLGGIRSKPQTEAFLQRNLQHWEEHNFGLWVFREQETGRFVGRGGLRRVEIEGIAEVELNYVVGAVLWGRGFATEMAKKIVAIGCDSLGLRGIVAFTQPTNRASRRVMEKTGLVFERDITHCGLRHVLYRASTG